MLKPRNILIIIIITLVALAAINMLLEFMILSSASQSMDTYVKIAANSALRSATVADEFFTSGVTEDATYVTGITKLNTGDGFRDDSAALSLAAMSASGLTIDLHNDNTFVQGVDDGSEDTNIFSVAYPVIATTGGSDYVKRAEVAYTTLFSGNDTPFGAWARNIWNADVHHDCGYLAPRALYWSDTDDDGYFNGLVRIPRLLTLGAALITDGNFNDLYASGSYNTNFTDGGIVTEGIGIVPLDEVLQAMVGSNEVFPAEGSWAAGSGSYYGQGNASANIRIALGQADPDSEPQFDPVSQEDGCLALLKSLDYISYKRVTSMADDMSFNMGDYIDEGVFTKDTNVTYYYTPLSIGLTYIDPTVLDVLFRSNLDLLMRAKYIARTGYDLNDPDSGYSPFIDMTYYDTHNVEYAGNDATQYGNTGKPTGYPAGDAQWSRCVVNNGQIYYMRGALDYVDGKAVYNNIWGNQMTNTPVIEYMYIPITEDNCADLDSDPALREILGRAIDPACTFTSLLESSAEAETYNDDGDHVYDLVIAKCTFYADFCYPYRTATMRGMGIHFNDPDADTTMSQLRGQGVSTFVQNDYRNFGTHIYGADEGTLNDLMDRLTQTSNFSEDGDYEYVQYAYTTYFAVAN